ncbi:heme o synthase [Horticoccus luteus]|uniref:Protoheme IX farnesyltransferase n=1 Tax=Horticoccus luteus TaxID=2862869 RepID=A0A8F9TXU0_9BACT|nr:heme o synthase [Horticoccus luteus]QYM79986.1 heme o synthase [Horticoccus luteus]
MSAAAKFSDYLELTKPRLSMLSVVTALVGYAAARPPLIWSELLAVIVGTSLAAGGVAVINQWMEIDTDARMRRTASRPLPTGKIQPGSAFVLGWLMCIVSLGVLFVKTNGLATLFTLFTIISYLGWYTPAKRTSRWSTEIGALAGAFPPLIGWTAAENHITALGWTLFGLLFFWQIPHFLAIGWMYRYDYGAVKFPMLPVRDETGSKVAWWSFINAVALLVVTLIPVFLHLTTALYGGAALGCGLWFVWRAWGFTRPGSRELAARRLFFTSIAYLPLVCGALVIDRLFFVT